MPPWIEPIAMILAIAVAAAPIVGLLAWFLIRPSDQL